MIITLHKSFIKDYQKLPKKIQEQFKERRNLFLINAFHPTLKNHALIGKYQGTRSINITGDIRAIYIENSNGSCTFMRIGSHSQLYE